MNKIFLIKLVIIISLIVPAGSMYPDDNWAVYPFYNNSNFHPAYDFGKEVSTLFIRQLKKSMDISVLLFSGDDLQPEQSIKYIIRGTINKFSLSSYGMVFPGKAGYVHYRAETVISIAVYSNSILVMSFEAAAGKNDDKLGLTLMGGPGTSQEIESSAYAELQKYAVDSSSFQRSLPGKTLTECLEKSSQKIKNNFKYQASSDKSDSVKFFEIVSLDKNEVYFNGGSANLIKAGDIYNVYRTGKEIRDPGTKVLLGYQENQVGKIQVMLVLSEFLSKAKVIEEKEKFRIRDRIR